MGANKRQVHPAFYQRIRHYRDRIGIKDGRPQVAVKFVRATKHWSLSGCSSRNEAIPPDLTSPSWPTSCVRRCLVFGVRHLLSLGWRDAHSHHPGTHRAGFACSAGKHCGKSEAARLRSPEQVACVSVRPPAKATDAILHFSNERMTNGFEIVARLGMSVVGNVSAGLKTWKLAAGMPPQPTRWKRALHRSAGILPAGTRSILAPGFQSGVFKQVPRKACAFLPSIARVYSITTRYVGRRLEVDRGACLVLSRGRS